MTAYPLNLTPAAAVAPDIGLGVRLTKTAPEVVAVKPAVAPILIFPARHFIFSGNDLYEYHTDDGLTQAQRVTHTQIGVDGVVYSFGCGSDVLCTAAMYDVVTDRIYLVGTKTVDAVTTNVLAAFNPRTLLIELERDVTGIAGNSWDVCGPYWWFLSWDGGGWAALSTATLATVFTAPGDGDFGFPGQVGPAFPGGLVLPDPDTLAMGGVNKITVAGPTAFSVTHAESGADLSWVVANDGGAQRPYIVIGNKTWIGSNGQADLLGEILALDAMTFQIVPIPAPYTAMVGHQARWDPLNNSITVEGNADAIFGAIIVDVETAAVRQVMGGPAPGYPDGVGFTSGGRPDGQGMVIGWGAFTEDFDHSDTGLFDILRTGPQNIPTRIAGHDFDVSFPLDGPISSWGWTGTVTAPAKYTPGVPATVGKAAGPALKRLSVGLDLTQRALVP